MLSNVAQEENVNKSKQLVTFPYINIIFYIGTWHEVQILEMEAIFDDV